MTNFSSKISEQIVDEMIFNLGCETRKKVVLSIFGEVGNNLRNIISSSVWGPKNKITFLVYEKIKLSN